MGRPLNKKYFGNRNIGTGTYEGTSLGNSQNYEDDKIGGEGIASISWSTLGSFQGNSNVAVLTFPALPAPTLPDGVQATWTAQYEVESVFTGSGKTNLAVGDTFGVASVPGMIAIVTDLSGANAVFSVTAAGGARGDALALASIPQDTVGITLTKIAGTGTAATFLCDITFRVKASTVTITEKGSGYTGAETFTFTKPGTTSGTVPAGTIVLTTSTGSAGTSTNQENAIIMRANVSGSGTTAAVCDIIKQVSTNRYKVTDGTYTGIVQLGNDTSPDTGNGYIKATDQSGATYAVTKLTSRKAVLFNLTGTPQFADGKSVKWTFGAAVAPATGETGVVTIENA
jgi:hypothetical protein